MQTAICPGCRYYESCKKPCRPVELILAEDNQPTYELSATKKNGQRIKIVYHRWREPPESTLFNEQNKDGRPNPKRQQQVFSTEAESPFAHFDPTHKKAGLFKDRYFLGFSFEDLSVKYDVSIQTAKSTYHKAEARIYKLLQNLDAAAPDLTHYKQLAERSSEKMPKGVKVFLMHHVFGLRSSEIMEILSIKSPSYITNQIKRVSDLIRSGELNLIESTPQEQAEAKARLESQRKQRRENWNKNADAINAKRRKNKNQSK